MFQYKSIGDIGNIITGKTPSTLQTENFGDRYLFITPRDMKGQKYIEETERYLSEIGKDRVKSSFLPDKAICVSCIGSDMGKVTINVKPAITNQQINSVIVNEKNNLDFIYYAILDITDELKSLARHGTTMPIINKSDFSKVFIPCPSLSEQKSIAATLSALDDKIELNNRINKKLEEMAQAIFKSWFVDFEPFQDGEFEESELGRIPKGWRVGTLGEICENIFSGGTPSTKEDCYWNGKYNWLSSGETKNNYIVKTEKSITDEGIKNSSTRLAKKYDIVIASAGQGYTRGQTSLCLIDTYINQSVISLRADEKMTYPSYLYFNLRDRYEELRQISDSSSIRGSLTTKMLHSLKILVPPVSEQYKANGIFSTIIDNIELHVKQAEVLIAIRDILLPKLMSGEIRVPIDNVTQEVV